LRFETAIVWSLSLSSGVFLKYLSLLIGTLVFAPGLTLAQTLSAPTTVASVLEPTTSVPSVVYRSVFVTMPTGVETESLDWRAANAAVGQFKNGYRDILKWEESEAGQKADANEPMRPKP